MTSTPILMISFVAWFMTAPFLGFLLGELTTTNDRKTIAILASVIAALYVVSFGSLAIVFAQT